MGIFRPLLVASGNRLPTFLGSIKRLALRTVACDVCDFPLEPLVAELLHCELQMADLALWIG